MTQRRMMEVLDAESVALLSTELYRLPCIRKEHKNPCLEGTPNNLEAAISAITRHC